MKKIYLAPEAEVLTFAKEDVITTSYTGSLDLPTIDLGTGGCVWSEDGEVLKT